MNDMIWAILCSSIITAVVWLFVRKSTRSPFDAPVAVNYHYTRECNFSCGFCFHTARTSYVLPLDEAKRGISMLKDAGMRKLNFAGGEPLLDKSFLGQLILHAKAVGVESVSIVTNGSLMTRAFLAEYGHCIDVVAVSCDSFDKDTNKRIGRKSGAPLTRLAMVAQWCKQFGIKFKINTVVNAYNVDEDMNEGISLLAPFRWKCFQVLIDESENVGRDEQLRDVTPFLIDTAQYNAFLERHASQPSLVAEPNDVMRSSYLILDEYMRFLSKEGDYAVSPSILDVGVKEAQSKIIWRQDSFLKRGGLYNWTRDDSGKNALDW